jgi:hypothetical protein
LEAVALSPPGTVAERMIIVELAHDGADPALTVAPITTFSSVPVMGCTACSRDSAATRPATTGFLRRHRASLLVIGLYALLAVLPGLLISALGSHAGGSSFIRFTDWREWPGALFLYLVLAPVIWTLYLWQPRLIVDVFDGLATGGVIGPPTHTGVTADAVMARLAGSLPRVQRVGSFHISRGGLLALLALAVSIATSRGTSGSSGCRWFSSTSTCWSGSSCARRS